MKRFTTLVALFTTLVFALPTYASGFFGIAESGGGGGSAVWGTITGSLADQTDLQNYLNLLAPIASPTFTGTSSFPGSSSINGSGIGTFAQVIDSGLTANTVLYANGSKQLTSSAVTPTTLAFLDATSSIQTQLNGKQPTLSTGDLTETGSANLVVTGGTGAVIGSGVSLALTGASVVESTSSVLTLGGATNAVLGTGLSIQVKQSGTSQSGYLSSTDWNTFNGKQASGNYLTALTGDVTSSGPGSAAATIASNAVTNAKAAQMGAGTIKGNNTGSTANAIDLNVSQVQAMLGVQTSSITSKTSNYTTLAADNLLNGDSSGGAFTFTLLAAATAGSGKQYTFRKTDASVTAITISDVAATFSTTLNTQGEQITVYTDGSSWFLLNRYIPSVYVAYTPTITGFGTPTGVSFFSRRVGDSLEVIGQFTSGIATAVTAVMTYGFNGSNANVSNSTSKIPTATAALLGTATTSTSGGSFFGIYSIATTTSTTGFNISNQSVGAGAFNAVTGSAVAVTGNILNFHLLVPIAGWNG